MKKCSKIYNKKDRRKLEGFFRKADLKVGFDFALVHMKANNKSDGFN